MTTPAGSVQSVARAIELLERLTDAGGEATLSELAKQTSMPLPTIHRLTKTLVQAGYVRQLPNRRYALGARLMRLGDAAGRQLGAATRPLLAMLADELGESVNLAVRDGDAAVYVAQASSGRSMRMFTEVGRRVELHCTGVGKVILAALTDGDVRSIAGRSGLPAHTEHTLTDATALLTELGRIRDRGFAIDDGEQELGVRCYAVPVPGAPAPTALSVSGPDTRVTTEFGQRAVPLLRQRAAQISAALLD